MRLSRLALLGSSALILLSCIRKTTSEANSASAPNASAPGASAALPTKEGPWLDAQLSPQQRVDALLAELTQAEKLQLVFGYFGTDAPWMNFKTPEAALPGSAGYVPGIPRLHVPAQYQTDAGVGVATQGGHPQKRERTALPSGLATAASWNPELAQQGGAMIGAEARASGFNVMLAGGVNLLRDPRCGRNFEYGGEDPLLAGTMVGAQIAGIQSNHVISTVKHFAINDQETDRKGGNSVIDDASARMSDLLAFQFAIERGNPGSVMCAYNKVNGDYSCENRYLLNDVLRTDWGYKGYVMSDWGAVHSTEKAANSGLEQESGWPFDDRPYFQAPLQMALNNGSVTPARLDEMVSRILYAMFENGLFEHPPAQGPIDFEAHAQVTRADAEEGSVLLKNTGQLLPLSPRLKSIAIIGGYADKGVLSGGGSAQVYPVGGNAVPGLQPTTWPGPVVYNPSSPLAELRKLLPQTKIEFNAGKDRKAALALAKQSEVVIVFATQWTTEDQDTSITLPDSQDALIAAVAAANPKTVVVLETGGPVLLPWEAQVPSILEAWFPGTAGGAAIARLLTGAVNPSGHLPATFIKSADQLPHPGKPKAGDVRYVEGATVGYKWFDKNAHEPLFPFGHGLSYTSFSYDGLSASAADNQLQVTFRIKNTGAVAGKDVAQIYVARPAWEAPKRLGAFAKVELAPGEEKEVSVTVDPRLLASFDAKSHAWLIQAGALDVLLASSSREIISTVSVELQQQSFPAHGRVN